ncbi:MAG: radical SAM protein [Myxococcales bacterium]|nr:radical SAM protein [Myxococcales bacterium]
MRSLLIQSAMPFDIYRRTLAAAPVAPSLAMAALAGATVEAGHSPRIVDCSPFVADESALPDQLINDPPEIVGLTAYTAAFPSVPKIVARVAALSPNAKIVLGGVHATVLPRASLIESGAHAVVIGEGERTWQDLLRGVAWRDIPGLLWRDGLKIVTNPPRERIADLDQLPFPDYSAFNLKRYDRPQLFWKKRRIANCETSRGCPFHCTFCSSNAVFGRRWRAKSPGRVIEELRRLAAIGFEEVHFQDDGFTTDLERAKEICRLLVNQPLKLVWELKNGIRAERTDREFFRLARRAGCYRIQFGIETGDPLVLEAIGKHELLSQFKTAVRLCRQAGIESLALFILGLPEDTKASLKKTARFARRLRPDFARASILSPFPGTAIYQQWKNEGRLTTTDWSQFNFHQYSIAFRHPRLDAVTIQNAYRRFYRGFYWRVGYFAQRLYRGLRRGSLGRDLRYFLAKFVFSSPENGPV